MPFLPGWKTAVTIDSEDLTIIGQTLGFSMDQTALPKPTFGQKSRNTIAGQQVATISIAGHVDETAAGILFGILDADQPVTYTIQIGELLTSDGGSIAGNGVLSNFTLDADADGQWAWSAELETDGDSTYTPPA